MKKLLILSGLFIWMSLDAQVLEVPTLKSKGVALGAVKVELNQFDYVKDKGLTLSQSDVETYDEKGRLISIDRKVQSTGLSYRYTYKLSKKGILEEEKIVNSANNQTVRTTTYTYKKGLLVTTTQVQGTVTFVKNYSYNKDGHMIKMEAIENGTAKGEEIYQVDEEGRQTRKSQKLPTEEVARTISTFTYSTEGNLETKTETRNVNNVKYEIVVIKDLNTERNLKETNKNLSNSKSGFSNSLFVDDEKGSWTKGEVLDNGHGRPRLVLRKITYQDGSSTGRTYMAPEDDRAQYYRQSNDFQVLINGAVANTTRAFGVPNSDDRLTYHPLSTSWILLKDYNKESYQTTWHEGQMITHTENEVLWAKGAKGVAVYQNGKALESTTASTSGTYNEYPIVDTRVLYFGKELQKTLVVKGVGKGDDLGKVQIADFTDTHRYWGKASDSTFTLVTYGGYTGIHQQIEDVEGNKLVAATKQLTQWYSLPKFNEGFDNGSPGDLFPAAYLTDPAKEIKEGALFTHDLENLVYDNLKDNKFRLKTEDGKLVTNVTNQTLKTHDNELIAYFPLTKRFILMENYYEDSDAEDFLDQPVTTLMEGHPMGYYLYNDGAKIAFYRSYQEIRRYRFDARKLNDQTRKYTAVLYDSTTTKSYKMNYDLDQEARMGPIEELPYDDINTYILKFESGGWVIFEQGTLVRNYDYSVMDGNHVIHFFKDQITGKAKAYKFKDFKDAEAGDFISSELVSERELVDLSLKLKVNPLKPIEKK